MTSGFEETPAIANFDQVLHLVPKTASRCALQRKNRRKQFPKFDDLRQQAREVWVENGPFLIDLGGRRGKFWDLF